MSDASTSNVIRLVLTFTHTHMLLGGSHALLMFSLRLNSLRHIARCIASQSCGKNFHTQKLSNVEPEINICDDDGNVMLEAFSLHVKAFLNVLRGYVVEVGYDVCDEGNANENAGMKSVEPHRTLLRCLSPKSSRGLAELKKFILTSRWLIPHQPSGAWCVVILVWTDASRYYDDGGASGAH